jgi:hypothetical protein
MNNSHLNIPISLTSNKGRSSCLQKYIRKGL